MFGIGGTELLVILVVALIVLGPKSLPQIAKTLGRAMGEFRRVSTDFQRTLNTEIALEDHEKRKQESEEALFGDTHANKAAAKEDAAKEDAAKEAAEKESPEKTAPEKPAEVDSKKPKTTKKSTDNTQKEDSPKDTIKDTLKETPKGKTKKAVKDTNKVTNLS